MFKKLIPLFTIFILSCDLSAQLLSPCTGGNPAGVYCGNLCARCDFDTISGVTGQFPGALPYPAFCGTLSAPEWFAFVAGAGSGTFILERGNCQTGSDIQMALYDDCSSAPLACQTGGGAVQSMPVSGLVPGETYFLIVDGANGAMCDYKLYPADPALTLPPPLQQNGVQIVGPQVICKGTTATYCLSQPVAGAAYYTWQSAHASINGGGEELTLPASAGTCVEITFGQTFSPLRCTPKNSCQTGMTINRSLTVSSGINFLLPGLFLSSDELPYNWQNGAAILTVSDTTYSLENHLISYLNCDSTVRQIVFVHDVHTAQGIVYWDINNNQSYDDGIDLPNADGVLLESAGGKFSSTDEYGQYRFKGLDDLEIFGPVPIPGLTISPPSYTFDVASSPWLSRDFALYPPPVGYDLKVYAVVLEPLRPGFSSTILLQAQNAGFMPAGGITLTMVLPPFTDYESASLPPGTISGDTLYWYVPALASGAQLEIAVTVKTAVGTMMDLPFDIYSEIQGTTIPADLNLSNNVYVTHGVVRGAFDPNDKRAYPEFVTPAMIEAGQRVEYTIRFQNTGNYPAEIVRIVDTLADAVHPGSFRLIGSSHPCRWKMSGQGVVEILFDPIDLPDSLSNEPASHGFVSFSVALRPEMELGETLENVADIYFDFNTPVRTNIARTQAVYFLPGLAPAGSDMSARPNPASYRISFAWDEATPAAGRLRIYSMLGLPATDTAVPAGSFSTDVYVAEIPNGTYFAVLEAGSRRYVKTVLIQRPNGPIKRLNSN